MDTIPFRSTAIFWTLSLIFLQLQLSRVARSASIFTDKTSNSIVNNREELCNLQIERTVKSDGKESSLIFDLRAPYVPHLSHTSCKRILKAPESHGFLVRLARPSEIDYANVNSDITVKDGVGEETRNENSSRNTNKTNNVVMDILENTRRNSNNDDDDDDEETTLLENVDLSSILKISSSTNASSSPLSISSEMLSIGENYHGMESPSSGNNSTKRRSCPLSVFSSSDPLMPPWKIDPCLFDELGSDHDEPVRLFQGHLRIIWNHDGHTPKSKLIVTVLGKGAPCQEKNKHPCLRIGYEALLCISKDLVCDGIRHCPRGNEYDSDEDIDMCTKSKHDAQDLDDDLWEHLKMEIFKNFLNGESSTSKVGFLETPPSHIASTTPKIDEFIKNVGNFDMNNINKKNVTRGSIAGDLSRYGPWGYLMLGMLLCGGALLICGLWECCCRQNKSGDNITAATSPPNLNDGDANSGHNTSADSPPPNYDDIDPPPAYSVLFPNQKASVFSNPPIAMPTLNLETSIATTITTTNAVSRAIPVIASSIYQPTAIVTGPLVTSEITTTTTMTRPPSTVATAAAMINATGIPMPVFVAPIGESTNLNNNNNNNSNNNYNTNNSSNNDHSQGEQILHHENNHNNTITST